MATVEKAISNETVTDNLCLAQLSLDVLQLRLEGVELRAFRKLSMYFLNNDMEFTLLAFETIKPFMCPMAKLIKIEDELTELAEERR